MSNTVSLEDRNKFYNLTKLLQDPKNKATYERWIKNGFPKKQVGGKDGELFLFFKNNFGLDYGENEEFLAIVPEYNTYLQQDNPAAIPELELSKVKEVENNEPLPEKYKEVVEELKKELGLFSRNSQGKLSHPVKIQALVKKAISNRKNLTDDEKSFIEKHLLRLIDAKYEADNRLVGTRLTEKLEKYKNKIKELDYTIEFPKNELEKKKAMRKKQEIKDKIERLTKQSLYKKLTKKDTNIYNNSSAELNSYVPNKSIPLFVKNANDNGFHRITMEEINALKNDPSGDFYDGTGILGSKLFRKKVLEIVGKTGGSNYINTNYKPDFPTTPFSVGW